MEKKKKLKRIIFNENSFLTRKLNFKSKFKNVSNGYNLEYKNYFESLKKLFSMFFLLKYPVV